MIAALLVSPAAGMGAAARVAGRVAATLRESVDRLDTLVAVTAEGSAKLARSAVDSGADVLVVLGGDGMAHVALQACADSATALAVVPAGTGNDLARALAVPGEPLAAAAATAAALRTGHTRTLDLGRVAGGSWFATVLCAGFDSAVNERANRLRWPRGPRRYDLAVLTELARMRPYPLVVETDTDTVRLDATMVSLGNLPYYGGGIPICPDARPDDGLLDITVVGAATRRDLVAIMPRLRTGKHMDHPAVRTLRARSVHLSGENHWVAYADGERQARLPLTVRCVPAAVSVLAVGA
ncbi:MAG TPA: YegS/Rv2252/BmrU family lipid kinase [Pseudonocardiaceae bacterium]|nr:YegS/Rv2252/BmrU family lipid kinase [Pseudonocardiaceae bacterium]